VGTLRHPRTISFPQGSGLSGSCGRTPFVHLGDDLINAVSSDSPPVAPWLPYYPESSPISRILVTCLSHNPDDRRDAAALSMEMLNLRLSAANVARATNEQNETYEDFATTTYTLLEEDDPQSLDLRDRTKKWGGQLIKRLAMRLRRVFARPHAAPSAATVHGLKRKRRRAPQKPAPMTPPSTHRRIFFLKSEQNCTTVERAGPCRCR